MKQNIDLVPAKRSLQKTSKKLQDLIIKISYFFRQMFAIAHDSHKQKKFASLDRFVYL